MGVKHECSPRHQRAHNQVRVLGVQPASQVERGRRQLRAKLGPVRGVGMQSKEHPTPARDPGTLGGQRGACRRHKAPGGRDTGPQRPQVSAEEIEHGAQHVPQTIQRGLRLLLCPSASWPVASSSPANKGGGLSGSETLTDNDKSFWLREMLKKNYS